MVAMNIYSKPGGFMRNFATNTINIHKFNLTHVSVSFFNIWKLKLHQIPSFASVNSSGRQTSLERFSNKITFFRRLRWFFIVILLMVCANIINLIWNLCSNFPSIFFRLFKASLMSTLFRKQIEGSQFRLALHLDNACGMDDDQFIYIYSFIHKFIRRRFTARNLNVFSMHFGVLWSYQSIENEMFWRERLDNSSIRCYIKFECFTCSLKAQCNWVLSTFIDYTITS